MNTNYVYMSKWIICEVIWLINSHISKGGILFLELRQ